MKRIGSYLWPDADKVTPEIVLRESSRIPAYLKHCKRRGVCVQAGGNCGVYAQILAHHFKQVFTFEPDLENWICMSINITAKNVVKKRAALGDVCCKVETWRTSKESANYGATMVRPSDNGAEVLRVDDMGFTDLDFIFLDIEGFELPALKGAEQSIRQFLPTIAVEVKGLGQHYGYTDANLVMWLEALGYHEADKIGRDIIFLPLV